MKKRILLFFFLGMLSSEVIFAQSVLSFDRYWDNGGIGIEWTTDDNWGNNMQPEFDADTYINNNLSANISSPNNITIESVAIGANDSNGGHAELVPPVVIAETSGNLTIASGATLTATKGVIEGNKGIRLEGVSGNESNLNVSGTLNVISNANGDGIDIGKYTKMTVFSTGTVNVNADHGDAFNISDDLENSGTIIISAVGSCDDGIKYDGPVISGSKVINNAMGSITINGGNCIDNGIHLNNDYVFDNFGTVTISNVKDDILLGDVTFNNYGTFAGDGVVNAKNFNAGGSGANISPGTSTVPVGKFTFENAIDLSNVNLLIDVNGASSYDQIETTALATINITNAILDVSGSTYTPSPGDEFMIINNNSGSPIIGTFFNLGEGDPFFINGVEMMISYVGGDGDDISASTVVPLPVELISFNGFVDEHSNLLKWQTASEENTMVFIVERSLDGASDFEEIDRINAVGFSSVLQSYKMEDRAPVTLAYYRLRIVDFDGTFEFSDIIAIERSKSEIDLVEVYPVPAEEEVTVLIHSTKESKAIMILSDFSGRKIKEERILLKPGINRFTLNWKEHESNIYYLTIDNGKEKIAKKILRASRD